MQAATSTKDSEENANAVSTVEVLRQETVATASLLNDTHKSTAATSDTVAELAGNGDSAAAADAPNKDVYYKDNGRTLFFFL